MGNIVPTLLGKDRDEILVEIVLFEGEFYYPLTYGDLSFISFEVVFFFILQFALWGWVLLVVFDPKN